MPTMQLSVNVQLVPFGSWRTQQVVQFHSQLRIESGREERITEPVVLPPMTLADYIVPSEPVRVLNY